MRMGLKVLMEPCEIGIATAFVWMKEPVGAVALMKWRWLAYNTFFDTKGHSDVATCVRSTKEARSFPFNFEITPAGSFHQQPLGWADCQAKNSRKSKKRPVGRKVMPTELHCFQPPICKTSNTISQFQCYSWQWCTSVDVYLPTGTDIRHIGKNLTFPCFSHSNCFCFFFLHFWSPPAPSPHLISQRWQNIPTLSYKGHTKATSFGYNGDEDRTRSQRTCDVPDSPELDLYVVHSTLICLLSFLQGEPCTSATNRQFKNPLGN